MSSPTTAAEIVKNFPSWKYDTHGWFECVWCHAFTNAKTIVYSDPKPGKPAGHIEAEDVTAHKSDCPLASIAVNIDAYARQQVEAATADLRNPRPCREHEGEDCPHCDGSGFRCVDCPTYSRAADMWQALLARERKQVEAARLDWSCPLCHCCGEKRHDGDDPCVSCATAVEAFRERALDWLAHRCEYAPPCGICKYCLVAAAIRALEP